MLSGAGADRVRVRPARRCARWPRTGAFCWRRTTWAPSTLVAGQAPFVAGPHLNVYNAADARLPRRSSAPCAGCRRWRCHGRAHRWRCLPEAPATLETEVFAYGRLPLAFSARCFTARHYNLPKDDCEFRCLDHPGRPAARHPRGRALPRVQRHPDAVVPGAEPAARARRRAPAGIDALRVSPQSQRTGEVVAVFRAALDDVAATSPPDASTRSCPRRLRRVLARPAGAGFRGGS